jgi:peroxiredoxin Q/BCP
MLNIGDKMPDFQVINQNGKVISSTDLLGKKTIIYFYPKDNTSGCTAEACNLRDNHEALMAKGYNVVGVSKDSVASHRRFIEKYALPFTLLADTSTEMIQAFGAWGEKRLYGKVYMGTLRRTFIFDEHGILTEIIEDVDTKRHAEQILQL